MLNSQFIEFHIMEDSLIQAHVWQDAKVYEKQDGEDVIEYHRMDILWSFLDYVKDTVTGQQSFSLLAKVAQLILTLLH